MLTTNSAFDNKQALHYKWPVYIIEFDGEEFYYTTQVPTGFALDESLGKITLEDTGLGSLLLEGIGATQQAYRQYLINISGLSQRVVPEEGQASIGGITFELLDYNGNITTMLASDSYYFHRKLTTVKAGYAGMLESDFLSIMVGWVTDIKMGSIGGSYVFTITDPQKWFQRKIFRGAEDSSVSISGNAINILLAVLTSTGAGTNGDYDWYAAANGLGLDTDYIDITAIENVRDLWYPGQSAYFSFTIEERETAKNWLEREIFKPLNLYPVIDGQGRFLVKPFKPPLPTSGETLAIDEDTIIGTPTWDMNLGAVVNECEFHYGWDGDDYVTKDFYLDADSLNNRGPGNKSIVVKSRGVAGDTGWIERSANRIFNRFADPPIKITLQCFFSKWTAEAGDVVRFSHAQLPDLANSQRGISEILMEVTNRSIDWNRGRVKLELLQTGFAKAYYQVISPTMTITSVVDRTNFFVSTTDAAKYENFTSPEVQVCDSKMRQKVASITLTSVNSTTGLIHCDNPGLDLAAGYIVVFADYDNATAEQQNFGYIADASDYLGAANDAAHLIVP